MLKARLPTRFLRLELTWVINFCVIRCTITMNKVSINNGETIEGKKVRNRGEGKKKVLKDKKKGRRKSPVLDLNLVFPLLHSSFLCFSSLSKLQLSGDEP